MGSPWGERDERVVMESTLVLARSLCTSFRSIARLAAAHLRPTNTRAPFKDY